MKKTLAAISASLLGVGTAVAAGAAPAQAAPLPACNTASDHVVDSAVDPSVDDWYMTCVPQYGMGKAEFTITTSASDPFPADYKLTDGKQTITSSAPTETQVKNYFGTDFWAAHNSDTGHSGAPKYLGAFMNPELTAHSSTSQTYGHGSQAFEVAQSVAYRITSVGKTASLPADCFPSAQVPAATYQGQYKVTYAPTTTTFTETVKGERRTVTVTYTPSPLFLGLNFDTTGDAADSGGFDNTKPLCASSGGVTVQAASANADPSNWFGVSEDTATNNPEIVSTLVPQPAPENLPPTAPSIGTFRVTSVAVHTGPELALTGINPVPLSVVGGGLVLAGIGANVFGRRRRRPARSR